MKKGKQNITLEVLATKMDAGFKQVNERFDKVDKKFYQVNENHESLARMVAKGFEEVDSRFVTLERGQEEIKLRLDNVAYKFEVVDLEKRVGRLEAKAGIRHK